MRQGHRGDVAERLGRCRSVESVDVGFDHRPLGHVGALRHVAVGVDEGGEARRGDLHDLAAAFDRSQLGGRDLLALDLGQPVARPVGRVEDDLRRRPGSPRRMRRPKKTSHEITTAIGPAEVRTIAVPSPGIWSRAGRRPPAIGSNSPRIGTYSPNGHPTLLVVAVAERSVGVDHDHVVDEVRRARVLDHADDDRGVQTLRPRRPTPGAPASRRTCPAMLIAFSGQTTRSTGPSIDPGRLEVTFDDDGSVVGIERRSAGDRPPGPRATRMVATGSPSGQITPPPTSTASTATVPIAGTHRRRTREVEGAPERGDRAGEQQRPAQPGDRQHRRPGLGHGQDRQRHAAERGMGVEPLEQHDRPPGARATRRSSFGQIRPTTPTIGPHPRSSPAT